MFPEKGSQNISNAKAIRKGAGRTGRLVGDTVASVSRASNGCFSKKTKRKRDDRGHESTEGSGSPLNEVR